MTLINISNKRSGSSQERQQCSAAKFESGWEKIFGKRYTCARCATPKSTRGRDTCCDSCEELLYEEMMHQQMEGEL